MEPGVGMAEGGNPGQGPDPLVPSLPWEALVQRGCAAPQNRRPHPLVGTEAWQCQEVCSRASQRPGIPDNGNVHLGGNSLPPGS